MRIEKKDISVKDPFGDLKESAKGANAEVVILKETLKILTEQAKALKTDLPATAPKNLPALKKQNLLIKDSALLTKQWVTSQNALTKAQAKADVTSKSYRDSVAKLKIEQQALNKEAKLDAELTSKTVGAYRKKGLELAKLKKQIKDLIIVEGAESKQVKKLLVDYDKLNKKVRTADQTVGDFGRTVGNYPNRVGKAVTSLKNLASSLGVVAGIAGLARAIKGTITIYSDFEQSNANLGAILGATDEEVKSLTENSKRLGAVTAFTATQVTELATEYGKLGFKPDEIIKVTEATLALAQATGTDLGQSAQQVGSTLRAYGLDANEAGRVTDIFAKAASASALDMEKLATALPIVGTTSKIAGISLERTTALLGTLADRGLDASTSATSLRNVYLELSKQGLTWDDAMGQINNSLDKNATALALFGKRGATTAVILAENADSTKSLTKALEESAGVAEEMAEKQLDTLQGSVKLLTSAWESLVLEFYEGNGALIGLKNALSFVAKNLKTIVTVVGFATKAFLGYKLAMFALKLSDRIKEFKAHTASIKKNSSAVKSNGTAMSVASVKAKAFGRALKGIGVGVAIALFLELAIKLYDVASGAAESRRQIDLLAKSQEQSSELGEKFNKITDDAIKKKRQELDLLVAIGTITQKQADKELKLLSIRKKDEALKVIDRSKAIVISLEEQIKAEQKLIDSRSVEKELASGNSNTYEIASNKIIEANKASRLQLQKLNDKLVLQNEIQIEFNRISEDTSDTIHDYTVNIADNSNKLKNNTKDVKDNTDALKKNKEEIKKISIERVKELDRQRRKDKTDKDFDGTLKKVPEKVDEEVKDIDNSDLFDSTSAIIEGFTDKFLEAADARISKIDEEISAAQKQSDIYAQLAADGNITAKESLAEQNSIIAEAEAEKLRIEQRKQNIQLASSVVLAYNNALQDPSNTPADALKEAFLGTATIQTFIAALSTPSFFDGTENTGTHGQGVDGIGGFKAILHPNERVITSKQNDLIGNISNDEVSKIMFDYRMGKLDSGQNIVVSKNDNSVLEKKMDNVTEAIKNIPQNNIEVGEINQGYMMINQTKTKGKTRTRNSFKVTN
jgi:hypothetical protein